MPLLQARNAIYEMRYYTLSQLGSYPPLNSWFGGIQDRFDLIIPPLHNVLFESRQKIYFSLFE